MNMNMKVFLNTLSINQFPEQNYEQNQNLSSFSFSHDAFQIVDPGRMQYGMSHMNLTLAWLVLLPEGNAKFLEMRIMNLETTHNKINHWQGIFGLC